MAVGTQIIWNSEPIINENASTNTNDGPLFLACFTAPKGPEDLRIVTNDFDSLYGTNFSFAKYGQPLLQARRIITAGGRLLCRRLVPEDATYGNLIIAATVDSVDSEVQKTDAEGNKIYVDNAGIEYPETNENVTEDSIAAGTYVPVMVKVANVKYYAFSEESVQDPRVIETLMNEEFIELDGETEEVTTEVEITKEVQKTDADGNLIYADAEGNEYPETNENVTTEAIADGTYVPVMVTVTETTTETTTQTKKAYPLFAVVDNGRGNTGKRVRIDFKSLPSKSNHQAIYTMTDVENSVDVKAVNFTLDPDVIVANKSYAISKTIHPQFNSYFSDAGFVAFVNDISEYSGIDVDELKTYDLLFGRNFKGEALPGVIIDPDSIDMSYSYGMILDNGSDGSEDISFGSEAYNRLTEKFFDPDEGTDGEDIYNTDIYKIDVVADANYSMGTKAKIVDLAEFRKDFFYFRDLGLGEDGLGLTTFDAISNVATDDTYIKPSKFAASYHTSYMVVDPYTQKPIHVTCTYSLVDSIINHFNSGRYLPFGGYTITDYIDGTIDFVPKQTPKIDQKELMENIRVNVIAFTSLTNFMIETMLTSTGVPGQLDYIQNVLAVQHVIKDIRTYCPAHRLNFTGSDDFAQYANDISENVLIHHMTNFASLVFTYENNDDVLNTEFNAALIFSFNRHIQSEVFSIYAED